MEGFFKDVLDHLPVCTIIYDSSGKVVYRNRATKQIDGYDDGELLGATREEYLERLQIRPGRLAVMAYPNSGEGKFQNGIFGMNETTLLTREGKLKNVLLAGDFIYDESKRLLGACGYCLDISGHARKVKMHRHTLEQIITNLPLGISVYNSDGSMILSNEYLKKLAGVEASLLGLNRAEVLERLGVVSREKHLELFRRAKMTGGVFSSTYRINGFGREVFYKIIPLRDHNGEIEKILVATRNATYEEEYKEIQYYLSTIVDSLDVGMMCLDRNGYVTLVNSSLEEGMGVSREKLLGIQAGDFFKAIGFDSALPFQALKEGKKYSEEINCRNNGANKSILLNISPVMDENKKFLGAITTATDYTRLIAQQKRIHEQEKLAAIGQMAAGLAHEIKNPLTTIKGFAQLLREKYTADPVLTGYVEIVLGEVDRAVGVLNDFLEFARPRQPKLIKKSIKKLLDEFLTLFEPQSFLKNIIIQYESAAGLPECVVDVHQMKQVLFNICKNAVEAMPGGGTLSFRDGLAGEEIYLDIHDTGCGIPKEKLKDVGVPFNTTKDNGTGLGLSISYAIIEAHRGRVEIESMEGQGTRFRLYLPVTYSPKDMGTQQRFDSVF